MEPGRRMQHDTVTKRTVLAGRRTRPLPGTHKSRLVAIILDSESIVLLPTRALELRETANGRLDCNPSARPRQGQCCRAIGFLWRSVAQPGSAPRLGRGGRRFKSFHSDQPSAGRPAFPQVSANTTGLQARRVHQRVHQRRLRMASFRQDSRGNYVSRKKLPVDVRDDYGRLFGQRHEAKFFRHASTDRREAQRQFSEWSAEVDGNIIAIRARRDGTGLSLTPANRESLREIGTIGSQQNTRTSTLRKSSGAVRTSSTLSPAVAGTVQRL
jgi:hypothetical protein